MNKQEAIQRLDALDAESRELRKIIEAPEPEPKGLWKPRLGDTYYYLSFPLGTVLSKQWENEYMDEQRYTNAYVFKTPELARRAIPIFAHNNKIVCAALMADPDAGEWAEDRKYTAVNCAGTWAGDLTIFDERAIYVHTIDQAKEMARILNEEGV